MFSQNFMTLHIRFRHLYGEVISRADEYNTFRLIADIGSAVGLYFGFSILTIYEFCVFVFVKNAAEGIVPPPQRKQLYDMKGEKQPNLQELAILPVVFWSIKQFQFHKSIHSFINHFIKQRCFLNTSPKTFNSLVDARHLRIFRPV